MVQLVLTDETHDKFLRLFPRVIFLSHFRGVDAFLLNFISDNFC